MFDLLLEADCPMIDRHAMDQIRRDNACMSRMWHRLGGNILCLIGSLMLVIGPFLPWAKVGFMSGSGVEKTGNEAIVLTALGVIGVVIAVTSLITKRNLLSLVPLLVGLVGLGLSVYDYLVLRDDPLTASLGAGIYVCLIGGVVVLVSALLSRLKRRSR